MPAFSHPATLLPDFTTDHALVEIKRTHWSGQHRDSLQPSLPLPVESSSPLRPDGQLVLNSFSFHFTEDVRTFIGFLHRISKFPVNQWRGSGNHFVPTVARREVEPPSSRSAWSRSPSWPSCASHSHSAGSRNEFSRHQQSPQQHASLYRGPLHQEPYRLTRSKIQLLAPVRPQTRREEEAVML